MSVASNGVASSSTARYVFDFAAGAFAAFGSGDVTITIDGYTTTATVTARSVTAPTTVLVAPIDTVDYASRGSLTVDVRFVPSEGASIPSPAATLIQLKQGSTVVATSIDRTLVSGSTYRFAFSAAALASLTASSPITVVLATAWNDSTAASAAIGTLGTIRTDNPSATLAVPGDGTVVGSAELAALGVDVQFHAVDGQSIETSDIAAGLVTLYQPSNGLSVAAGRVTRVGNTFHFDQFASLPAFTAGTIEIRLGSWHDSGANSASASTLGSLTLASPSAVLVTPVTGGAMGAAELPGFTVSILFAPVGGASVQTADITAGLVTLRQTSGSRAAATVTRSGDVFTFHFGSLAMTLGAVFVDLAGWHDSAGNAVAASTLGSFTLESAQARIEPQAGGSTLGTAEIGALAIDVTFVPVDGHSVDDAAVPVGLVRLIQGATTFTSNAAVRKGTSNTFTFTFASTAALHAGQVTISVSGNWHDNANNTATTTSSLTLVDATAAVAAPGALIGLNALGAAPYVDITFLPAGNRLVDAATIDGDEVTITGPTALTVGAPVRQGNGNTFRYSLSGGFA